MTGTAFTKSPTTTNSAVRGGRGTREPAAVVLRSEDGSAEDRCSVNRAFMRPLCDLYALTAVDGMRGIEIFALEIVAAPQGLFASLDDRLGVRRQRCNQPAIQAPMFALEIVAELLDELEPYHRAASADSWAAARRGQRPRGANVG